MAVAGEDGVPVTGTLVRDDLGQYSNLEGYGLRGLGWNGKVLYHNPYWEEGARLSDDEIAMAGLLDGMCRYVHGGEEIYPLEEALQDTYLYLMMDEAIRSGREIETFYKYGVRRSDRNRFRMCKGHVSRHVPLGFVRLAWHEYTDENF
ncbi:MAG: hypothetical protein V8R80_07110 [Eubacterium sp.]